jgi:glycerol-3-phosphate dehydrogenase
MDRAASIHFLDRTDVWDIIVTGGGATGLGVAVDAALRGFRTLLLEQADFTKGTSSRSTKLVHGGVRYLAQKDVALVFEALHERGILLKNAPHLSGNQTFIIPEYKWWKGIYYTAGLKLYDLLAGRLSLGKSEYISAERVKEALPTVKTDGLTNGVLYHDGQFDDARLGINLAQSCCDLGGHVLNYFKVTGILKNERGRVAGVEATDMETGKSYKINSKVVVNATGVFTDDLLKMDIPGSRATVKPSQGTHVVLDKSFLPSDFALMIPETDDGRVLFAIPWHDKIVAGTTDVPVDEAGLEPRATEEEVSFILNTLGKYLSKKPEKKDVLSVFTGLRPLAMPSGSGQKTKEISRSHKLIVSASGLITITGGKWTTYRKMAEETVDKAITTGGLQKIACSTSRYKIHGYTENPAKDWLSFYGADAESIRKLAAERPELAVRIHPDYPFIRAEIIWSVRNEMARTVEDILARRLRLLFLDARAALASAPQVAEVMAAESGKSDEWIRNQVEDFEKVVSNYLPF